MRTIRIEDCRIEFHDWGARTHYGEHYVDATPHPEMPHYHVIAHRCGYGDDLLRYTHEHEACHELIAQFCTGHHSEVLFALARGKVAAKSLVTYEELAAQALQRFIRANERPIVSGVKWDALRDYALEVLDGT